MQADDGTIIIAYNDEGSIKLTTSTDGANWSVTQTISSDVYNGMEGYIDINYVNNKLMVAYRKNDTIDTIELISSSDNGTTWSSPKTIDTTDISKYQRMDSIVVGNVYYLTYEDKDGIRKVYKSIE
jgi:hypothetical protein